MRKCVMAILCLGFGLGAALLGAPRALADPVDDSSGYISLAWGDDPTSLDWRPGSEVAALGSFVADSVVVPGDRAQRTLLVRNDGPTAAIATVQFSGVVIDIPDSARNYNLANLIHLNLILDGTQTISPTWQQVADAIDEPLKLTLQVPQGGVFSVTAGYSFPITERGGQSHGQPSTRLSFGVMITLTEHEGGTDVTPPTPPGPPAQTGGGVLNRWASLVTIGIIGIGAFLILLRRDKQAA